MVTLLETTLNGDLHKKKRSTVLPQSFSVIV